MMKNKEIEKHIEKLDVTSELIVRRYIEKLEFLKEDLDRYESGTKQRHRIIFWTFTSLALFVAIVIGGMYGFPKYSVWQKGLAGQASLKRAEQEKLIMIETAKAELEASKHRAEAIAVMGAKAKEFPEYRHQEFIGAFADALQNGSIAKIIYVPTEANIPIVEAGRMIGE